MLERLKLTFVCCFVMAFAQAQQSESMHLHFDKDIYLPGETIWFKAYFYYNNTIAARSTNFYTAIYDENGKLLDQKTYIIMAGSSYGDFTLADTIQASKIQFIAYTKAMLLEDSNNVFSKILTFYKKEGQLQQNEVAEGNINLQFFPEGGNWVAGINNFIAFKAWYDDGSPAEVSGKIMDEERHLEIDSFSTNGLGLGRLQMTPGPKMYTALWKGMNGKTIKTALPAVSLNGVVIHTEQVKNNLYYIIHKNSNNGNLKKLHLLAQRNNIEIYNADILIGDKAAVVNKFSIDSIPPGLIQLTLFDNDWNPLQERIIFLNTEKKKAVVKEIVANRQPKAKNVIELEMPDTLFTNLSASIADINFYNKERGYSIKQDLWLNSQLKGLNNNISNEIESGNAEAIDLIMLTHGWRKYDWKSINRTEEAKPVDNYLALDINYKERNYALLKNENLALVINDKISGKQFYSLNPVTQTSFSETGIIFYDTAKVYYRLKRNNEIINSLSVKKRQDVIMPLSIPPLRSAWSYSFAESKSIDTFSNANPGSFNRIKTIKEVVVKSAYVNPITKRIQELDAKYTSGLFSGIVKGYQLNVLDDEKAWGDIYTYIKYRVPARLGVAGIPGGRQLYPCTLIGMDTCDPLPIFINENESPGTMLEALPLSNIAYIKYIPGIWINSTTYGSNGVLYVYTKKGDEVSSVVPGDMRSITMKGYDLPKEFFNPDYDAPESRSQQDMRTTLYWNPYLVTNKENNKVKMEYYNNDISKRLLLTIEGINEKGELIHIEKIIE